jgi:hypothetical protein
MQIVENRDVTLAVFTLKPDGQLELTGMFSGYTGEPYRPIEEFDYFFKTFGVRH